MSDKKLLLLRPEEIFSSCDRPRKSTDEYDLRALAKSIKAIGIIEPICVRRDGKNRYVLVCGYRRLAAAKLSGLRRVPCVVTDTDEAGAAVAALAENLLSRPLDFFCEAFCLDRISGLYGISLADLAARLGTTAAAVEEKINLLKIDPLERERILAAGLTERHARALLRLNKSDVPFVLDTVIEKDLSAAATEQFITSLLSPASEGAVEPVRKSSIGSAKLFANSLSRLLLTLENAGVQTNSVRKETEDYIEYEIRIEKNTTHQLAFSGI